jgi:hypothetical protein
MRTWFLLIALTVCVGLLVEPPRTELSGTVVSIPDARVLRLVGKPYLPLVTDFTWIRMVAVSVLVKFPNQGLDLIAMGHVVADLDPQFFHAYYLGGLLGPVRLDSGEYANSAEAVALLKKGVEQFPDSSRLALVLAYTQFFLSHDIEGAAATMASLAHKPGVSYAPGLAVRLLANSGRFDAARDLVKSLLSQASDEERPILLERLQSIDLEETCERVDQAAAAYLAREGHPAPDVDALVSAGLLPSKPVDPLGWEIILTPNGSRSSGALSRLQVHLPKE